MGEKVLDPTELRGQRWGLLSSLHPQFLASAGHGLDLSSLLREWSSGLTGTCARKPGDAGGQAAKALDCRLVISPFHKRRMLGTCLEVSGIRKLVAGSYFKVVVCFLILKSQLLGIDPRFLGQVSRQRCLGLLLCGLPCAGPAGASVGTRAESPSLASGALPFIRELGHWDGDLGREAARATLSEQGFLGISSQLPGG